ncbi:tetratricopeptide repeat protein [Fibrella sp. WM1]|uniref:tetratricopeptide repeat protein n=1 Tax=Fibrella musci TaxID=3242485 RepID=UPI003521B1B1
MGMSSRSFHHLFRFICWLAITGAGGSAVWGQSRRSLQPDSTFRQLKSALNRAVEQQDLPTENTLRQQIGLLFYHQGNYTQAIDYLLQAQKGYRAVGAGDDLANNLNELGTVYYYNRQSALARKQFDEALAIYRRTGNRSGIARTYGHIGHLLEKEQNFAQAFAYQKRALAQYQTTQDEAGLGKIYENIGSIFEDQARYDSARYYYQHALLLSQKSGRTVDQLEIINNLGDLYRKTGQYDSALTYYRQVMATAQRTQETYQLNGVYRDLGKTYQLLNRHDSAYAYFERSHDLTDELYAVGNNQQIALLQTLFDVEQKDNEIARLSTEKRMNTILSLTAGLVLLLLGGLAAVIISRQRLKIRNERALNEQNRQIFDTQRALMEAEMTNQQLAEENLRYQLALQGKELSSHTLHLIQKNQVLEELKNDLTTLLNDDKRDQRKQLKQLVQKIGQSFSTDKNWDDFRATFDQVHPHFFTELTRQFPELTPTDLRLIALLKMNLPSGEMAAMLGISPDSLRVARYRLRKKLGLPEGESLTTYLLRYAAQPTGTPAASS